MNNISNLKLAYLEPSKLIGYIRNPRKNDQVIQRMIASISEFGFTIPILAKSDGSVIDGHLRLKAAIEMKMETVPVVIADHMSESQIKAFRLLANRSANWADWDEELLKIELTDLKNSDFDLSLTGFDDKDINFLLDPKASDVIEDDSDSVVDKVAECQQKWQVQLGDLYQCGNHRILCGDSTKVEDVAKVLMNDTPLLMVTDPPYGIEYDADWRTHARNADGSLMSTGTGRAKGKVENDDNADWSEAWKLFTGDVAYIWHGDKQSSIIIDGLIASGFELRSQIIWAKNNLVISRGHYHPKHECCWYAVRKGTNAHWIGDHKQTTVWEIDKPQKSETGHSTQKPIECMAKAIQNHESEFIYEPFSGSGTTLIACEQLNRKCLAIELNPSYVAIALERWSTLTGQSPVKL